MQRMQWLSVWLIKLHLDPVLMHDKQRELQLGRISRMAGEKKQTGRPTTSQWLHKDFVGGRDESRSSALHQRPKEVHRRQCNDSLVKNMMSVVGWVRRGGG